jgi:hypothetical protein
MVPGIRSLQLGPLSQPVIVNDPNEPLIRLLVSAHIHECTSLQAEGPQVWQFSFQSPTEHPYQFFEDVILIILCQLGFRIFFLEDSYLDIDLNLFIYPWSTRVPGPFLRSLSIGVTPTPLRGPSRGSSFHSHANVLRFLGVPSSCLTDFTFFSYLLAHPNNFVLARWSLPTPGAKCLRPSPYAGILELLVPCSGVSELLNPERGVLDIASGKFLTAGSSLPLTELSTAGSLVAPAPLLRHSFQSLAGVFPIGIAWEGSPSFFWSFETCFLSLGIHMRSHEYR